MFEKNPSLCFSFLSIEKYISDCSFQAHAVFDDLQEITSDVDPVEVCWYIN